MTSTSDYFGNLAKQSNVNIAQSAHKQKIEDIINSALEAGDQNALNNSIGQILTEATPEERPALIEHMKSMGQQITKQKEGQALQRMGIDPDLSPELQKEAFKQSFSKKSHSNKVLSKMTEDELLQLGSNADYREMVKLEFKRREDKPASKGRQEFEKQMYKDVQETLSSGPHVMTQFGNIDRMEKLSKKMEGVTGYLRKQTRAEFDALSMGALEAPIKALFGSNRLSKEKFTAMKEAFVPKSSDTRWTQRGKMQALKTFNNEAREKIERLQALYDVHGLDIPLEEIYKLQAESESMVDRALSRGERYGEEEEEEEEVEEGQQQPFNQAQQDEEQSAGQNLQAPSIQSQEQEIPPPPVQQTEEEPIKEPSAKKSFTQGVAEMMDISDEFQGYADEGTAHKVGVAGRGAAKAVGSTLDFANWLGSLISSATTVDVEKLTKDAFGESMDIEGLAEKAYDFVTGDGGKPEGKLDEYIQSGAKVGTEFALPLGLFGKGGRAKIPAAALEGFLAGEALQTAKDLELGPGAELASLFLPMLVKNSPGAWKQAYQVAKNPSSLAEMAKDLGRFMKEAPKKTYEAIKKKATKPTAKTVVKKFDLKKGETLAEGVEQVAKKARQPLSEVFSNESVNALEAKMSQQAEGAKIYKPLFDEISQKNFDKYEKVIAGHTKKNPKLYMREFDTTKAHKELKQTFMETVMEESDATKAEFRTDFNKLQKARTKDARITPAQTRNLVKSVEESINDLKKGGTIPKDAEPIKYLESFKERLLEVPKESAAKITELEKEISAYKDVITKKSPSYAKEVIPREKELAKLSKFGAKVEEVEKGYRKINKALNWNKKFEYKDVPRLKLKANISKVIRDYGNTNTKTKKYSNLFEQLNKRYSNANETILSDMVFKFIHGEDPELVKMWLDTPKGVTDFNKLISDQGNLFFNSLGDTLKTAKAHEMVLPKIFNEEGRVRATLGKFSTREKNLLHSLLGNQRYDSLNKLTNKFTKDVNKIDSYLNKSGTYVQASMDAKKLLKWSGFWDGIKGVAGILTGRPIQGAKSLGKSAMKIFGANQDKLYSMLLTDTEFQKVLLDVVKDSEKVKPNFVAIEKMAKLLKKNGIAMTDVIKEESKKD